MGRLRITKEQRETLLDAFVSSGLSGTRFAATHGIKYQTFATWVQKRRHGAPRNAYIKYTTFTGWIQQSRKAAAQQEVEEDVVGLGSYDRNLTVLVTEAAPEEEEGDAEESGDGYIDRWKDGRFPPRK